MPPSTQSASARPEPAAQTGAEVPLLLATPVGQRWPGFALSAALHGLLVAALLVRFPVLPMRENVLSARPSAIPLAPAKAAKQTGRRQLDPAPRALDAGPLNEASPETADTRIDIDMKSIQLDIADDVANQLPGLVSEWGGALALMERNDLSFACYLIRPPEWSVSRTLVDVRGKFQMTMDPAWKWAVLRTAAERNSIALDHYRACALFGIDYKQCLYAAIRLQAMQRYGKSAIVRQARVAFEGGKPCGVNILEINHVKVSKQ